MTKNSTIEDAFLQELQKEKTQVSVFLVNGIKLHGVVDTFSDRVLLLKNSVTQMVFKHAISTVVPSKAIEVKSSEKA